MGRGRRDDVRVKGGKHGLIACEGPVRGGQEITLTALHGSDETLAAGVVHRRLELVEVGSLRGGL